MVKRFCRSSRSRFLPSRALISASRALRTSSATRSHLFTTTMQARRCSTITSAIFLSCSVMPLMASITKTAISQRAMASLVRSTEKYSMVSSIRRALRTPAVSTSTYCSRPASVITSNGTSTASRVVPGIALTMTRCEPVSWLMIEDLPTFGRPTMARRFGPTGRRGGKASPSSPSADEALASSVPDSAFGVSAVGDSHFGKNPTAASIKSSTPLPWIAVAG